MLSSTRPLSLSFERSLCRFFTLCLPVCLQRPVIQISPPALFPSLSFERSLCRFFTLCPPVFLQRPVTQISVLALLLSSPLFPSLSFERSLCRFFTLCLPICLQRPVTQISATALFSLPFSLSRDPYVGFPLSVSSSVFRNVILISISM